jgi:hypothetical protein
MSKHANGHADGRGEVNTGLWLLVVTAVMIAVIAGVILEERDRWQPKGRR